MNRQDAFAEAVYIFQDGKIAAQMLYQEFEALLNRAATLDQFAASVVRAAYVAVGPGLAVKGAVCFLLEIDEEGRADPAFSVPVRHLLRTAGPGPDLGVGPIKLACRGQCSVPWQANNLWDPVGEGEEHAAMALQRAVWRNKLALELTAVSPQDDALGDLNVELAPPAFQKNLESKLTEAFGDEGRVNLKQLIRQYNGQIEEMRKRYRADLEQQQQIYLDQIRGCRNEIQRLKANLKHEQDRNRRLQELLRGGV